MLRAHSLLPKGFNLQQERKEVFNTSFVAGESALETDEGGKMPDWF